MKIGIIGVGVVGGAVEFSTKEGVIIYKKDLDKSKCLGDLKDLRKTDLVFVCLPTPNDNGVQDLSTLFIELKKLSNMKYKGVVVVKSTTLPGSLSNLVEDLDLKVVHNPEFLSQKNAKKDFFLQEHVLLSGDPDHIKVVAKFFEEHTHCFSIKKIVTSIDHKTTEWAKYMHNCSLALKLSFLNEAYNAMSCNKIMYDNAVKMAGLFGNLSGLCMVPGPDGQQGFGGACFPKDMTALASFPEMNTIRGANETNKKLRPEYYNVERKATRSSHDKSRKATKKQSKKRKSK